MSWRKNAFDYVLWFLYTVMTGGALAGLGGMLCTRAGAQAYWGILFAVLVLAVIRGAAGLLHRLGEVFSSLAEKRRKVLTALECALAAGLLVLGCLLRIRGIEGAGGGEEYYEAAKVVADGRVPQIVHGAVYFYVQLLHVVLRLLGNQYVIGIWFQIVLQLAGSLVLFLAVRKGSGAAAALVTFAFCMCGPYMTGSALMLSPDILYFVVMTVVAAVTVSGCKRALSPLSFLFIGILAALCCYLDAAGGLVLLTAFYAVFCSRKEEADSGRKAAAVLLCLTGTVLGMLLSIFTDAFLSGKRFLGVVNAWLFLYRPEGFILPVSMGGADSWQESLLLLLGMAFGVFGFWYDRRRERISLLTVSMILVILASCCGILTEEMPGFYPFYLLLALAAGQGVGVCLGGRAYAAEKEESGSAEEPAENKEAWEKDALEILELEGEETDAGQTQKPAQDQHTEGVRKPVQYLENPLPLPKKHVRRVMDYPLQPNEQEDDFDHPIAEDDDFDL